MSAVASGLRWFGTLLVNAAEEIEAPRADALAAPQEYAVEVEEDLRRMRERVTRVYY
jgi:hypothetical protein